jgi:eukaryotic-like serine/threonine-protein kinase
VSDEERSPDPAQASVTSTRLDSWKEIAAHLKRDVTTVRRWEKREGLPVHRHRHEHRESVYAFASELDQWWTNRRSALSNNGHTEDPAPNGAEAPPRRRPLRTPLIAAAIGVAVGTVVVLLLQTISSRNGTTEDEAEYRFAIFPPDQTSFGSVALSPNGRHIVFTALTRDGVSVLFVRALDALTPKALPGTEGARFPFWSPSSDEVGFFANGQLLAIALAGAAPRIVCEAPSGRGGSWNRRGVIVFTPDREGVLARVPAVGGQATPTSTLGPGERGHLWPAFLPDGNHFLYLADSSQPEPHNLFVGALNSTERTKLFPLVSSAEYADGHLFFARNRQLVAMPFDADRVAVAGEPVVVGNDVLQQWATDHKADFSVSENGVIIFRSLRGPDTQLVWRDRNEGQSVFTATPAQYAEPTLSPDERHVAVDVFDPHPSKRYGYGTASVTSDIWLMNRQTGAASRMTFDPGAEFDPIWSPDGRRVAYSSNRNGTLDLYQRRIDSTEGEELLLASAEAKHAQAWSPDGRWIVFATYNTTTRGDLWLLPLAVGRDRAPVPLVQTEANEEQAQISPDGRWLAYTADGTGRDEVYVRPFPQPAGQWQVSARGGGDPRWRGDSKELFYLAADRRLIGVAVKGGATFEHGDPTPLFDTGMQPHWGEARNHYEVSRDGQRFLVMTPVADDRLSPFTILLNWSPAGKK